MDEAGAALLAGGLASAAALLAATLTAFVALKAERQRREQEQATAAAQELRSRAADVFVQMFALQHELEWLTWHARHQPAALDAEMLRSYNTQVHAVIPKLLGTTAVVASLSVSLYSTLSRIGGELFNLDAQVASLLASLGDSAGRQEAIRGLADLNPRAHELYVALPTDLSEAMKSSGVPDWDTLKFR
jgi:hypothetical protein